MSLKPIILTRQTSQKLPTSTGTVHWMCWKPLKVWTRWQSYARQSFRDAHQSGETLKSCPTICTSSTPSGIMRDFKADVMGAVQRSWVTERLEALNRWVFQAELTGPLKGVNIHPDLWDENTERIILEKFRIMAIVLPPFNRFLKSKLTSH